MSFPVAHGSLESYEREELGFRERFSTPTLGGGRTIAVHAEPLGDAPMTWVVLESFGPEHDNLAAFDAALCRSLAAAGHAAFRFHGQGQGDSELGPDALGIEAQVAGALDAVELARGETASGAVGLVGVRFGGAIAALAAARTEVSSLALIDPIVKGRAFLRALVRMDLTSDVALGEKAAAAPKHDPFQAARERGVLEIEGFAVPWPAVEEIEGLDLLQASVPTDLPSLVVAVSRTEDPRAELRRLAERLGPRASLEVVVDENAFRFGLPPWRLAGPRQKVDALADLTRSMVGRTVDWCTADGAAR
jgi:pimeloyl-ACP methyl ester carboxylesterase